MCARVYLRQNLRPAFVYVFYHKKISLSLYPYDNTSKDVWQYAIEHLLYVDGSSKSEGPP